jgi:serine/threonine protein kinase
MAHGNPPYVKERPLKIMMSIAQNDPPSLKTIETKKKFSKNFHDFLKKCLSKDPKKRPSAKKLLEHKLFKKVKKLDKGYIVKNVISFVKPKEIEPIIKEDIIKEKHKPNSTNLKKIHFDLNDDYSTTSCFSSTNEI